MLRAEQRSPHSRTLFQPSMSHRFLCEQQQHTAGTNTEAPQKKSKAVGEIQESFVYYILMLEFRNHLLYLTDLFLFLQLMLLIYQRVTFKGNETASVCY